MAIHSDAPLHHSRRYSRLGAQSIELIASECVQGAHEQISIEEAMYAITLGAAYTLHMDHEIGSIEVGKRADFAILADDPFEAEPIDLKDISVWGTVQSGRIFDRIIYRERNPCNLDKRIFGCWKNYTHQQLTSSAKWKAARRFGQ